MELFPPLSIFYNAIANDARIGATHISVYMALLQQWNLNGGKREFEIKRLEIMKAAKINARHTYNRCMSHLREFGYINYQPSPNSSVKSIVILKYCETEK